MNERKNNEQFNFEKNSIKQKNNLDIENNLINIEDLINELNNDEELSKIVNEDSNNINELMNDYNINLINDMIEIDINAFKNNFNEFLSFCKQKTNKLELLDYIYNKIKEKLIINYELMEKKQENNVIEYKILIDYENKLDYIISVQNNLINELESINNELNNNLNYNKKNDKENEINEEEINKNINEVNKNIMKMGKMIEECSNGYDLNNLDKINIDINYNEDKNFFEVINNIYQPIKEINKAYEQIMIECASLKNK